jgi:O-antigen ligase
MVYRVLRIFFYTMIILLITGLNDNLSVFYEVGSLLSPVILLMALLVLLTFRIAKYRIRWNRFSKALILTFALYLFWASVNSISLGSFENLYWGYRYYIPSLLIYVSGLAGFLIIVRRSGLDSTLKVLRIIFLLNAITIILTYFLDIEFLALEGGRFSGINLNANQAGYFAVIGLILQLHWYLRNASRMSLFNSAIIAFAIFLTFSKTAYLMGLIILGYFLFLLLTSRSFGVKLLAQGVIGLIVGGALLFVVFSDSIFQLIESQQERLFEFGSFLSGEVNEETTTYRTTLASYAVDKIAEAPLFGQGFRTFSLMDISKGVHNQYLLLWGEAGLMALFGYLWLLSFYFRNAGKLNNNLKFLIRTLVIVIAMYSLTNHNMYGNKGLMLMFALITTILIINSQNVRNIRATRSRQLSVG